MDITSLGRELASSEQEIREQSIEDVRNLLSPMPFNGDLERCQSRE